MVAGDERGAGSCKRGNRGSRISAVPTRPIGVRSAIHVVENTTFGRGLHTEAHSTVSKSSAGFWSANFQYNIVS
jgi:hypothetical protein